LGAQHEKTTLDPDTRTYRRCHLGLTIYLSFLEYEAMKKQTYVQALMRQPVAWIKASAATPNGHMTPMHILLHYVALRRMGEI
jgi:hypothetical protein